MWVSPGRSSCASLSDDPGLWVKCTDCARSSLCSIEENVQVPVEIRGGRCHAASRVSVPDTFLTLRRLWGPILRNAAQPSVNERIGLLSTTGSQFLDLCHGLWDAKRDSAPGNAAYSCRRRGRDGQFRSDSSICSSALRSAHPSSASSASPTPPTTPACPTPSRSLAPYTGRLFPGFSLVIGWLGVFLTGSVTSSAVLFGSSSRSPQSSLA